MACNLPKLQMCEQTDQTENDMHGCFPSHISFLAKHHKTSSAFHLSPLVQESCLQLTKLFVVVVQGRERLNPHLLCESSQAITQSLAESASTWEGDVLGTQLLLEASMQCC